MARPRVVGESVYVRLEPEVAQKLAAYMGRFKDGPATVSKTAVINLAVKNFLEKHV